MSIQVTCNIRSVPVVVKQMPIEWNATGSFYDMYCISCRYFPLLCLCVSYVGVLGRNSLRRSHTGLSHKNFLNIYRCFLKFHCSSWIILKIHSWFFLYSTYICTWFFTFSQRSPFVLSTELKLFLNYSSRQAVIGITHALVYSKNSILNSHFKWKLQMNSLYFYFIFDGLQYANCSINGRY